MAPKTISCIPFPPSTTSVDTSGRLWPLLSLTSSHTVMGHSFLANIMFRAQFVMASFVLRVPLVRPLIVLQAFGLQLPLRVTWSLKKETFVLAIASVATTTYLQYSVVLLLLPVGVPPGMDTRVAPSMWTMLADIFGLVTKRLPPLQTLSTG